MAARLLSAAAIFPVSHSVEAAQAVEPGELDPSAPLAPLPDLEVDWPDLQTDVPAGPIADAPLASEAEPAPPLPLTEDGGSELRYAVRVEGLSDLPVETELEEQFSRQSALLEQDDEPANAAQIDRRSRADAELLAELLRSRGYFDAAVQPRVERAGEQVTIILDAAPGARYSFQSVELPGLEAAGPEAQRLRDAFDVQAGDPVNAAEVIAAGVALKVALGEQGFASAEVGEQEIEIDHATRTASLSLPIRPGPLASFGVIRVSGTPPFSARHVGTIARFDPGERFQRSKVDDLRRALIATGLVASAEVRVVPVADGRTVDLAVHLEPAPMRTIAGEIGYGTGEGVRVEASWQHRNFFNPEGAVTLRGVAGTQEQLAAVQFRRNNFLRRDQVLNLQALASNTERDAYEARTLLIGGSIERQSNIIWHKKWTYSFGADLLATDERGVFDLSGVKQSKTFLLTAFPASLGYDGSDDLLNPTRGFRLSARASPEISAHGGRFAYGRAQFDASAYHPIAANSVAAGRVRLATIIGAEAFDIAPSRRLYSGGGGSVRGYGYQKLGPRDVDGDPIGGRSLAEFGLEARVGLSAFGGNFGLVPFLDGGSLSNSAWPDFSDWQLGAGLGLRYYSSFGPIRIDVGTPLNPREGDSRVAVTVSLGQAF